MSGHAIIIRGDAAHLSLPDESVDLAAFSPPYFALRSYRDAGEHYDGQIGSEPHPQAFLESLWTVMHEVWRVLKPTGSCFVNLGDKRSGSGGPNGNGGLTGDVVSKLGANDRYATARATAPTLYTRSAYGRAKSKMLLPHRFAIGCEDGLADPDGKGWIVRQDVVWHKRNHLPESVTDRCADAHEYLFHFVKEGRYFAAVNEVREPQLFTGGEGSPHQQRLSGNGVRYREYTSNKADYNPLGKLPGSVWSLASEPLRISEEVKAAYDLPDHFAAFSSELVRRVILGWSPSGVCLECGEGRRPVVAKVDPERHEWAQEQQRNRATPINGGVGKVNLGIPAADREATITHYACPCTPYTDHPGKRVGIAARSGNQLAVDPGNAPRQVSGSLGNAERTGPWREWQLDGWTPPPTRPAVVCDPFGGTGTTAGVARMLGRIGVSVDRSADYSRLSRYFIFRSDRFQKALRRTNEEAQGSLL